MRKKLLVAALAMSASMSAQTEEAIVYFKDKPNAAAFLANPSTLLSQRAIDRRTRMNIAINETDAPVETTYEDGIKAVAGITVKAKSRWLNAVHVSGNLAVVKTLLSKTYVKSIGYYNTSLNASTKNAKASNETLAPYTNKFAKQPAVAYNYGTSLAQNQLLNADKLHAKDYTGTGMVIAVLDTGFPGVNTAATFANLRTNSGILSTYDFVTRSTNVYGTADDHGTRCLSNMAGMTAGKLIGTAPTAKYHLFRTEDAATETPVELSLWVEAAEKADEVGADIISSSLGYTNFDEAKYSLSYAQLNGTSFVAKGADMAFDKGMIVITCAGNNFNGEPSNYMQTPADAKNVLCIGAVNANKDLATFSRTGPSSDGRIKPDFVSLGDGAYVAYKDNSISASTGTSFATPILAGAIASYWGANPGKTNREIVDLVRRSADRFSNPDNKFGYGIPNFDTLIKTTLGVSNQIWQDTQVGPNPFQNQLSVTGPEDEYQLSISNALGQVCYQATVKAGQDINVQQLPAGLYSYQLQWGKHNKTGKIIK
jgi:serine protease AprX